MTYFIYILDQEHIKGTNKCKYTRSFPPRHIAACWEFSLELSNILKIERFIKSLSKKDKSAVIAEPSRLTFLLQKHNLITSS